MKRTLRIDRQKLTLILANRAMSMLDLKTCAGICLKTIYKISNGSEVSCKVVGKIAISLNVKVEDIILMDSVGNR